MRKDEGRKNRWTFTYASYSVSYSQRKKGVLDYEFKAKSEGVGVCERS